MLAELSNIFESLHALIPVIRDTGSARALTSIVKNPNGWPSMVKAAAAMLQFFIVGFHLQGQWLQSSFNHKFHSFIILNASGKDANIAITHVGTGLRMFAKQTFPSPIVTNIAVLPFNQLNVRSDCMMLTY